MRRANSKRIESGNRAAQKKLDKAHLGAGGEKPLTLFCAPASGSTAINYLAQDPELAEREAAVIFAAAEKAKK